MKIYHDLNEIEMIVNPVVTTGSFDGVHIGHKIILNRLKNLAREIGGESVLITFYPHPRKVLYPDTAGKNLLLINSQREKIELLRKTGLDHLIIINFTLEFSQISSIDFIRNILVNKLHAKKVVIGFNHHFGHNREGDYSYLYELGKFYGFGVEEIPEQDIHNETVSSTLIRKALLEGKIQRANAYLDHQYIIIGDFFKAQESLALREFPTFNLTIEEEFKLVPPDGVYAVNVVVENESYKGILNIKNNSGNPERKVADIGIEIHLFDTRKDMCGKTAIVLFAKRIRDEKAFGGMDELKRQILLDKAEVEDLIF